MAESVMQKVERFRDGIAAAKIDMAVLKDKKEDVYDILKDEFNSDTPDQARKVVAKDVITEARLAKELTAGLVTLEEQYGWGEDSTVPGSITRTGQERRDKHGR